MRAAVAFIAGIFAVFSVAATAAAEEVPKPKGECGGSYFQQYLKEPGRKAFAYAEDSSGRWTCGYWYSAQTGDQARTGALRHCRDGTAEHGVDTKCQIVATDNTPLWDERQTSDSVDSPSRNSASDREWKPVNETPLLVFDAPDLNFFASPTVQRSDYGRSEWACWREFSYRKPNACITYQQTKEWWQVEWVGKIPATWPELFQSVEYDIVGESRTHESVLGEFDTLRMTTRVGGKRKNCFLFSRIFSAQKNMIKGWYCAEVGEPLDSRTIADIISTIGVKGIEVPTEEPRFAERTEASQERSDSLTPLQEAKAALWNRIKNYTVPHYFRT